MKGGFMKRALLSQMAHEWKTNIWLILELAIVALAIWTIITALWITAKGWFQPRGFNPENVYSLRVKSIPENSPYFLTEYKDQFTADRDELMRRLRENPYVENVSLENNFSPYEYSFVGSILRIEGKDSITYSGNFRSGDPEIIDLLGIQSATGKTNKELTAMLERGEVLISKYEGFRKDLSKDKDISYENLIGKTAYLFGQEDSPAKIGDMVIPVKRSDYEEALGMVIIPFSADNNKRNSEKSLLIKVKDGAGKKFEEDFYSDYDLTHLRNVYLSDLISLVKKGKSVHRETEINIRLMVGLSFFLLLTIFLGLLGSFWFRVQQRTSEIAIRKTFGATNKDLFQRIIGEGLLLLLGGLLLTSACVWPFVKKITNEIDEYWYTLLAIEAITAGFMALGIILSLWYPAWRAMHVEPAIAVKEE